MDALDGSSKVLAQTAGAVHVVAAAAQLATGPVIALAITAAAEATVAAIASYAAVGSLRGVSLETRRHALGYVIARLEDEKLCDPLLGHAWRLAVGAHRSEFRVRWARGAARVVAGSAVARIVRKRTLKRTLGGFLKMAALADLLRGPARARSAHRFVLRARHHARAFAETTAMRAEAVP
jgi:hypothetical protein